MKQKTFNSRLHIRCRDGFAHLYLLLMLLCTTIGAKAADTNGGGKIQQRRPLFAVGD